MPIVEWKRMSPGPVEREESDDDEVDDEEVAFDDDESCEGDDEAAWLDGGDTEYIEGETSEPYDPRKYIRDAYFEELRELAYPDIEFEFNDKDRPENPTERHSASRPPPRAKRSRGGPQ